MQDLQISRRISLILLPLLLTAAGCGREQTVPEDAALAPPGADTAVLDPSRDAGAPGPELGPSDDDEAAAREAELAAREQELAEREAVMARREAAAEPWRERNDAGSAAPPPEVAPAPRTRTYTVPAGTGLEAGLSDGLSSESSQVGDHFQARLASPLRVDGVEVAPAGSTVDGRVTHVQSLKRIGGRAELALSFERITLPDGSSAPLAASLERVARSETKRDAATIGGSAAAGAILGRVIGGGSESRRTAIGAAAGAAIGTAVAARTDGETVELPAGTVLSLVLESPLTLER